ncbi:type II toxin-antitoxin system Phd/YefM family antitoxin [Nostoc sp.]|uniref:type II toxin-antitoxin system Phd/YefM family antitoxin n=1 Tax=Nostoc sp. TaxID=1180 RepID=UPI002FF5F11C
MLRISVEEAAMNLKSFLERVARGEEVILLEQDKAVARLVAFRQKEQRLATMKKFRDSLAIKGESLSATVINVRTEEHALFKQNSTN